MHLLLQPFQPAASHRCLWQSSHLTHSTPATLPCPAVALYIVVGQISRQHLLRSVPFLGFGHMQITNVIQIVINLNTLCGCNRSRHCIHCSPHSPQTIQCRPLKWLAKCLLAFDWVFLYFIYLFTSSLRALQLPTMPRAGCDTHLRQTCHKVANGDSVENCQRCISISFALKWKLFIRKGQTEVCNLLRWRLD